MRLSLFLPFEMEEREERVHVMSGTPVDCVILGTKLMEKQYETNIDLVVTGINNGANLGTDIYYSGTVGAARQGQIQGVNAIAFSYVKFRPSREENERCAQVAAEIVDKYFDGENRIEELINVNLPLAVMDGFPEIEETFIGKRRHQGGSLMRRDDGQYYIDMTDSTFVEDLEDGCDSKAVAEGRISVTRIPYGC
jgi:5'-nucleotidase